MGLMQGMYKALRKTAEVALVCATLIVMMYYVSIGYFPFESASAVASLAAPVALIGGLGGTSFLFLFGAPALIFVANTDSGRFDPLVTPLFPRTREGREPLGLVRCVLFLLCSQGASGAFVAALFQTAEPATAAPVIVLSVIAFLIGLIGYSFASFSTDFFWRRFVAFFSIGLVASAPLFVMFLLIGNAPALRGVPNSYATAIYYGAPVIGSGVGAVALWMSLATRVRRDGIILAVFVFGFVLLGSAVALGLPQWLLNGVMTAVTLRVPNATLLVTESVCRPLILRGAKLEAIDGLTARQDAKVTSPCVSPEVPSGSFVAAGGRLYKIKGVTILSRVGADWPVQLRDSGGSAHRSLEQSDYFVLPRAAIVDWKRQWETKSGS